MSFSPELADKRDRLLELLRSYKSCAVAFSAGVDSTVLAKAARLALGDRAAAVTGVSPSLADREREQARELAELIGIRHVEVDTDEFSQSAYTRNDPNRCYHCKTELFSRLHQLAPRLGVDVVLSGANVDDLDDYRPGMLAARELAVHSPLAECGITKDEVRALAEAWQLPIWDKPATPCLSSRVAYGEEVTAERLAMIDRAEQYLRSRGFATIRVRYHRGDVARLETPVGDLPRLCSEELRQEVVERLKSYGFKFVSVDLEGFRSGSLNVLVQIAADDSES